MSMAAATSLKHPALDPAEDSRALEQEKVSHEDADQLSVSSDEETHEDGDLQAESEGQSDATAPDLATITSPFLAMLVWPLIVSLPLVLSSSWSPISYRDVFPAEWYDYDPADVAVRPKPLGLILGLIAVVIGQFFVVAFFYLYKFGYLSFGVEPKFIQRKEFAPYHFSEALASHLFQPEGFVLLGIYLVSTWMFHLMPNSYYSFEGSIQWRETFLCLVLQDGFQYTMHRLEHAFSPYLYKLSHKPHHRFINPRIFDAFHGSLADTILMILTPLYLTSNVMRTCNVWTYMAFGSTYACWLTLIHSEYVLPWDGLFRRLGFGTPADHHVHHSVFKYNYGHLFMWFDILGGTYRDPRDLCPKLFNDHV